VLRAHGYATIVDPTSACVEYDSAQCGHCQRVIFVKPHTASTVYLIPTGVPGQFHEEPGAFCRCCMRPVCLRCHAQGGCTPWERQLEQSEARDRLRRAAGLT
jgi:hypothetical protein